MLSITIKGDDTGVRNYESIIYLGWHMEGGQIWNLGALGSSSDRFAA